MTNPRFAFEVGGSTRSGRKHGQQPADLWTALDVFRALLALGLSRSAADKAARRLVLGRGAEGQR